MSSFNYSEVPECYPGYNLTVEETLSYLYTPFGKYFIIVVVPIVSAFGLFGNGSFLYVVYRSSDMRTITNVYLTSLAVADSLLLINGALQYLWSFTHSHGLNFDGTFTFDSPAGCSLPNMLIYLCYFASVFLVTLVTMERYVAICHTLSYRVSKQRAIAMNIAAWVLSFTMAGFQIPFFDVRTVCVSWPLDDEEYTGLPDKLPVCFHACEWCVNMTVWVDFIQYILVVPAVIFMSVAMARKLRNSLRRKDSIRSTKSTQARTNLVHMIQINAMIFIVCLTPYEIINLNAIANIHGSRFLTSQQGHYITWIGRTTVLLNSAVNPLIYSIVNPVYRKAFYQMYCCIRCEKQQQTQEKTVGVATASSKYDMVTTNLTANDI